MSAAASNSLPFGKFARHEVTVSNVVNPDDFDIQLESRRGEFIDLMTRLQEELRSPSTVRQPIQQPPKIGQICAVQDSKGHWFRAKIESIREGSVIANAIVKLIDNGRKQEGPISQLLCLPHACTRSFPFSMNCALHGIQKEGTGPWTGNECAILVGLVGKKKCLMESKWASGSDKYAVVLWSIPHPNHNGPLLNLNDKFQAMINPPLTDSTYPIRSTAIFPPSSAQGSCNGLLNQSGSISYGDTINIAQYMRLHQSSIKLNHRFSQLSQSSSTSMENGLCSREPDANPDHDGNISAETSLMPADHPKPTRRNSRGGANGIKSRFAETVLKRAGLLTNRKDRTPDGELADKRQDDSTGDEPSQMD